MRYRPEEIRDVRYEHERCKMGDKGRGMRDARWEIRDEGYEMRNERWEIGHGG